MVLAQVSHAVADKTFAGTSEDLTRAEMSTSKMAHTHGHGQGPSAPHCLLAGGLGSSSHGSFFRAALMSSDMAPSSS